MTTMNRELFAGTSIFRPSAQTEIAVRLEAETFLRMDVNAGTYTSRDEINGILQKYFSFYDGMLKRLIPEIASRHVMAFVLAQYDHSFEVETKFKNGRMYDLKERQRWQEIGPVFRRATKYVAECIAMLAPDEAPIAEPQEVVHLIDRCWICAEQMVHLSMLSTQTFALFPDETTLVIRPEGASEWIDLRLNDPSAYCAFSDRVRRDTASRNKVIDEETLVYDQKRIADILDTPFRSSCEFSMTEAFQLVISLFENTERLENVFDVPFVSETQILEFTQRFLGVTQAGAHRLINGLSLRRDAMQKEGRAVWKPKQEYRVYTRTLFEFPHPTGTHFIWSKGMVKESLMMLFTHLVQKQLPSEWKIGTVPTAIEKYAAAITRKFESTVNDSLDVHGLAAGRFKSSIGQGAAALKIPDNIGEIDVLAYWENEGLLIVGDCKLVKPALEPATFRDNIDKFLSGKDNYVTQVQRKTHWVRDNAKQVAKALESAKGFPSTVSVRRVAPVLVTYYPAFASLFIEDVPCVALTELHTALRREGCWPYQPVHNVQP